MELLEREGPLRTLRDLARSCGRGRGAIALVTGPPGIGKSSLVRQVAQTAPPSMARWWGACDPLATPRPMGPIEDIALDAAPVRDLLDHASSDVPGALLGLLSSPTLMVVEDGHWIDDATVDALVHIGRRIEQTSCLLVITHRPAEIGDGHPLARLLGALATSVDVRRIQLEPMSPEAVARLAGPHGVDPQELHGITGGNPFFVTEVLRDPTAAVPESVAAAVLSRVARLSAQARRVIDVLAMSPVGLRPDVLARVPGLGDTEGIEAAVRLGLVADRDGRVAVRHELARMAIVEATPAARQRLLHAHLLEALETAPGVDPARLAHHAVEAADATRTLRHAPAAAAVASRRGDHRAAAEHLGRATLVADSLPPKDQAELWTDLAAERERFDDPASMVQLRHVVVEKWRRAGDAANEALQWVLMGGNQHMVGEGAEAAVSHRRAEELVEGLPVTRVTVEVRVRLLHIRAGHEDSAVLICEGRQFIEQATSVDAPVALFLACMITGCGLLTQGDTESGTALVSRAAMLARTRLHRFLGSAETNAAEALVEASQPAQAVVWADRAIEATADREQRSSVAYARMTKARAMLEAGRWGEADDLAREARAAAILSGGATSALCLAVEAVIMLRRGQRVGDLKEQLRALLQEQDLHFSWPATVALAERDWREGGPDRLDQSGLLVLLNMAVHMQHPWAIGEALWWLQRAGVNLEVPDVTAEPWKRTLLGDWQGAATVWEQLGRPHEQALALAQGDATAQRKALEILMGLGAVPDADRVRRTLREAGVTDLPVRSRRPVSDSPLTRRQQELLVLVAEGLTNAEIAERAFLSTKTVGNHVSAILQRLEVKSRTEAVAVARERGLLDE